MSVSKKEKEKALKDLQRILVSDKDSFRSLRIAAEALEKDIRESWVPCSPETNPDEDGLYLCTLDGELCKVNGRIAAYTEFVDGKWEMDKPDRQYTLFWRPVPEPCEK